MERLAKLKRNLKNLEERITLSKILLMVYDEIRFKKMMDYLSRLYNESTKLLTEYEQTKQNNIYNYIDNNCFEMEHLIEDIKVELDKFVQVDAFVYLNNKTLEELRETLYYYETVLKEEGTIFNAIRNIKSYAKHIISRYTESIWKYLEQFESSKVQSLLNQKSINNILEHYLITSSDWNYIYKNTKLVIKSIENKTKEFQNLLDLQKQFEYAYFLIIVGE